MFIQNILLVIAFEVMNQILDLGWYKITILKYTSIDNC